MDEEQGLASPLAGGLRGIRRTLSSSVLGGGRAPVQAQPDPQTTSLLNQNSLTLTSISAQLGSVSDQVRFLNTSLITIKDNLAISDQIERQREAAKQRREAIKSDQALGRLPHLALEVPGPKPNKPPELIATLLWNN